MKDPFAPAATRSSKFALMTSAVSGVPSENVTPGRNVKVNDVASSLICHDSASHGVTSPVSGSWAVNESTICLVTYQVSLPLPVPLGFRLMGSLAIAMVREPPSPGAPAADEPADPSDDEPAD